MTPEPADPFSCVEAFRFGWRTTRANWRPLLTLGAAGAFFAIVDRALMSNHGGGVPSLGIQILQAAVALAFLRSALRLHDGLPLDLSRLGELLAGFVTYLLTALLYGLIVVGGLALLVVPGVLWGLRFAFAGYAVADGQTKVLAALRDSSRLTQGVKGKLLELAGLALCLNVAGVLPLGLGLFLTIPTTAIAGAYVFRRLQARAAQLAGTPAENALATTALVGAAPR